jgi:hypothetical protein
MIIAIIRSMLGPFNAVLDYFAANPSLLLYILTAWASVYLAGAIQLRNIETKTSAMLVRFSKSLGHQSEGLSASEIYQKFYPLWLEELKTWKYWFIPHKHDLWPVRITPERVVGKLLLSPEWVGKTLKKNGLALEQDAGRES